MKKGLFLFIVAMMVLQTPAFAQGVKIAVFNGQRISAVTLVGQKGTAEVKARTNNLRQEMEKVDGEYKAMVESYQKQRSALSVENRRLKEIEIKRIQSEMRELAGAYREAGETARREVLPPLNRFLDDCATEFLDGKDYDLILDQAGGTVRYHVKEMDISEDIIKFCDDKWKAKGN